MQPIRRTVAAIVSPCHRVIDAVPVIGRQAGDVGQPIEVDLLVEMVVDKRDHPVQPLLVVDAFFDFAHVCRGLG